MSVTSNTQNARTLVATVANAAAGTTRGGVDLATKFGGFLTLRMVTGATAPTAQCICTVLVAHAATLPTLGSSGAVWKPIFTFGSGTLANITTDQSIAIDPAIMQLSVEFTGNTGQAVTCEAYLSEFTSYTTV